jgi:hypothetical protein
MQQSQPPSGQNFQQPGRHLVNSSAVHAPPTPPGDDHLQQSVYLAPHDRQQLQTNRLQTGAWVMQTIQMQHQHHDHNELHESLTNPTAAVTQQQTAIANYYYDIDDGFSDILSAPSTPEPAQIMSQNQQINQQQHPPAPPPPPQQQQQQLMNGNYHHECNEYLSYNTNDNSRQDQIGLVNNGQRNDFEVHNHQDQHNTQHHHHQQQQHEPQQQQQQQHFYQTLVHSNRHSVAPVPYMVAMSPDSSLSTVSSSPSDHSLYHASPPIPNCLVGNGGGPLQHQPQRAVDQLEQHCPAHFLPLSPPASSPGEQQQQNFPASQQDSSINNSNNSQVILKPINNVCGQQTILHSEQRQSQQSTQLVAKQTSHHHRSSPIHLWEFLKELLQQVETGSADSTIIRWLDRQRGVFKIEDSVRVAKLWGKRKNKPKMNYDKLSRSIRQYYKKGIMKKTDRSQRLVYQFCSAYCH